MINYKLNPRNCAGKSRLVPAPIVQIVARVLFSLTITLGWCGQRSASAHAGHDDIPETSIEAVGEIDPRFYARSEAIDATLVLDGIPSGGTAHLYLVDHSTNLPIAAEDLGVEQITPELKTIDAAESETTGIYSLTGLGDLTETATLSVEISTSDGFDIISFDNVIRPAPEHDPTELADVIATGNGALPQYIVISLIAANVLVLLLAALALLKYLFSRSKRRSPVDGTAMPVALLAAFGLFLAGSAAYGHAGDDHSGEGLVSPGSIAGASSRHFVPVETQLRGEVHTSTAATLHISKAFPALGRVSIRPDLEAAITAPTDGLLYRSPEKDHIPIIGETVNRGDVLVQLQMIIPAEDKVTIDTEKVVAEAELSQARQETQLARQELERAVQLGVHVSRSELDQLRTAYEVAREKETGLRDRIRTLTAALEGETSGVKTLEIRAPISGIISESHSTQGEYVNAGKALFRIINIDELFVEADIFESDLRAIESARTARIYVEGYPNQVFLGKLHSISPEIDPLRRTAKVIFTVKNDEQLLRGGMFARLEIELGDPAPALVVPKNAVVSSDYLKQVYRKIAPELYEAVPVVVSRFMDVHAVLEPGTVEPGDVIVTQGQYQVRMSPVVGTAD